MVIKIRRMRTSKNLAEIPRTHGLLMDSGARLPMKRRNFAGEARPAS